MLFNSTLFLIFFGLFFTAYWGLRKRVQSQNLLILAGSFFFYGWWDERFLILISLSVACDYICGLGAAGEKIKREDAKKIIAFIVGVAFIATIGSLSDSWMYFLLVVCAIPTGLCLSALINKLASEKRRRAYLFVSLFFNLGLLVIFKYFGFFTESLLSAAQSVGINLDSAIISIVLPVGISFYTFQTLSYTIDIWRGDMQPTRRLLNFAAYVSFFPQLVAGPIERARRLLPQFEVQRSWDSDKIASGSVLFLWGFYKKTVIADNLAPIVNTAFAAPSTVEPAVLLLGVLAFAIQIFCDFSGYSDMARGLARMLGFELMLNFNLPYFARTPSEFWRRWHISLSTWLRDYLYIPLGGNKFGKFITYRNLIITMLLGGLWHGAAWTFIIWGAFHGGILALYRLAGIDGWLASVKRGTGYVIAHGGAWVVMSVLTLMGWVLFLSLIHI